MNIVTPLKNETVPIKYNKKERLLYFEKENQLEINYVI